MRPPALITSASVALLLAGAVASAQQAPPPNPLSPGSLSSPMPGPMPSAAPSLEAPAPAEEPAETGPNVAAITVQGNRRVETEAMKAQLATKAGKPLDPKLVDQDVRTLWKLGFFSDVQVDEAQADGGGVKLAFIVAEKPSVHEVRIEGNDELSKDDLKDEFEVKAYQILDDESARKTVAKIQAKYVDKGYYLAEVTYRLEPMPDNEVDVVFVVNEHAKVVVKEIRFVGNSHVSADELKTYLQTQEGGYLSFLTSTGNYKEDVFQRDLLVLQGVYYDKGYIAIRVGKPALALSADKRFLYVTIPLEEGEQYSIGKVDFSGDLLKPKEELFKLLQIKGRDIFSNTRLRHDMQALNDLYKDQGYAYVNVTPDAPTHTAERTVDLTFDIQRGPKVTIDRIEFAGNDRTRDKVLRREMRVYEGDLYSGTGIEVSKQRITALGYFDSVDVETKQGNAPDRMDVVVTVKEKPTGTFQVGFGFSNVEQFIGTAQISQDNLFGWGWTGSFNLQLSSLRQLFQLSFLDPYWFDTKLTFSVDAYRTELFYPGFTRKANGSTLTLGYELYEDFRLFAAYTLEYVGVTPSVGTSLLLAGSFSSGLTSSVRFSFNYDKRDNRLFPTKGFVSSASAEFAPTWLLSQNLFQRYKLVERFYYPLPLGAVFKINANLSYIRATGVNPIPISERFFEGGVNTLRGYALLTVSPTVRVGAQIDPNSPLVDFPVGGNKELITNVEIEFPIAAQIGIRGVAFYDFGNAWDDHHDFFGDPRYPGGMLHDVGLGLRWFSPIGPLRFEWGVPLIRRDGDDPYQFQFTIGNFF